MSTENDNTPPTNESGTVPGVGSSDWFSSLDWRPWGQEEPTDADNGRCFLLWVNWRAYNPNLTAMRAPHAVIGKWSGGSWMSQTDDDDSWSGPVKAVTHFARL